MALTALEYELLALAAKTCCKVKKAAKTFAPPDMQSPTYNKKIARGRQQNVAAPHFILLLIKKAYELFPAVLRAEIFNFSL